MLAPLHVDGDLPASAPVRMEERAVPIRPQIDGRVRRVISDPNDLLIGGYREGDP